MTVRVVGRGGDERGLIIILWSLLLVAMVTMVAIVVDLGHDRSLRRTNQTLADVASLAGARALAGHGSSSATANSELACEAILDTLKRNASDFPSGADLPCSTLPSATTCTNTTTPVTINDATTAAPYVVTVQYPTPNSAIENSTFTNDEGVLDGTQCQRILLDVRRDSQSFFRGIIGAADSPIHARAVARGSPDETQRGVAALILLERFNCAALQTSGGGESGSGVVVESVQDTDGTYKPGRIHSDSHGYVAPNGTCTTNNNAGGYAIYGSALPAAGGGGPSITAQGTPDGTLGVISVRALDPAVNGRGAAVYPGGISPAPTAGGISSRIHADQKYNNSAKANGTAINDLRTRALDSFPSAPAGYTPITNCNPAAGTIFSEANAWVQCDNFDPSGNGTVQFTGQNIVFTGKVSVGNNKTLAFTQPRSIYARGCLTAVQNCSGGGDYSVSVAGTLLVNTGGSVDVSCGTRKGPGAGGSVTNWTEFAQMSGPFLVSGKITLCQTFVYMGEVTSQGNSQSYVVTSGPNPGGCTDLLPCPGSSATGQATGNGYIDVVGGSGNADWSAPNQLTGEPDSTSPFDDLAYWQESEHASTIKGQGTSRTEGVFFLPNSAVTFTGQATQAQPLNAQFISRKLNISGQGNLFLKPNPADSIKIPVPGGVMLIR